MTQTRPDKYPSFFSRLKLFFALSRTPHGLIDMATPVFAALIWTGRIPSFFVVFLGLLTAFAGYTAVYALNDIVDYRQDQLAARQRGHCPANGDLDAILVRHPMACGFLSFQEGLTWTVSWAAIAVIGAYLLNPVCLWIFAAGCALETIYCLLWRVSHYRAIVSGAVKTLGAVAAIFAVDPHPSAAFLTMLFLCFFFWEIGGQNIPNDWTDVETDSRSGAKTIPVLLGTHRSSLIVLGSILLALPLNTAVFQLSPVHYPPAYLIAALAAGIYLLLLPALQLWGSRSSQDAMKLFNRGSYYPLFLMGIVLIKTLA
ncbi:MAG: UbiA family prenyltransferase [Desulfatirhabdiaceae bacterium]|nr:UbiA family prenyltransferase [Desulfatirhabdiaceae bacterium]